MAFCLALLALPLCQGLAGEVPTHGPAAAKPSQKAQSPDLAIGDVRLYAWYWSGDQDEVTYHELTGFPTDDDEDPYPSFDVVATLANHGRVPVERVRVKTTLAYKVGPYPSGGSPETPIEPWRRRAKWGKAEWAKQVRFDSLLQPGQTRRIRLATVELANDQRKYWRGGHLWTYCARLGITVNASTSGGPVSAHCRTEKVLDIGLLD